MKKTFLILLITIPILISNSVFAQTPEVTNGLNYLTTTQNSDGSWGDETSSTEVLPSTTSVIETMQILNETSSQNYIDAVSWLQSQTIDTTDYLSQRIHALSDGGSDLNILLSYLEETYTGAWGGYLDFGPNILDTALAIQALKSINHPDLETISYALFYLTYNQNPDGGFGFYPEDDSNVYMTALVLTTLQRFSLTVDLATAINKATDYLIAHQNPDGGFGPSTSSVSTVYETALSYIALVSITTDATVLGNAVNYLTETQSADGSWNDDPYSTALALRALYFSENKPPPPTVPTTGTVTGRVVDASTNQPLDGVSVVLYAEPGINTLTDITGNFTLSDIPEGNQAINISLSGYAAANVVVDITAGSIVDVGIISLQPNQATGIIKGTVTDAGNNAQPLEGVTIIATGSFSGSTTTDINGDFIITNVTPGSITLTASKAGYSPVTASGTVVAGGVLFFSPQLSTQPPQTTTGSLLGEVFDSLTMGPVQGAAVSISGGPSASTDAQGVFLIEDVTPDTYQVTISAPGYTSQTYQVMIMEGVTTDMQRIYLIASLESTIVTGMVWDASTYWPVAGVDIVVVGTTLSAKTDLYGIYTLEGINLSEFTLRASATGYNTSTYNMTTTTTGGTYTADFALNPSPTYNFKITSLNTDKQSYQAYEDVIITATVENQGISVGQGLVMAEIQDIEGSVIGLLSPTEPEITLAPSEAIQTVIQWNTGQFPPGDYFIILKITDPETITGPNPTGDVLAEKETSITIISTPALGGSIALNPPVTLVDLQTPIDISAAIRNTGNVPISTTLILEASINETVVYSTQAAITGLQVNHIEEFVLGSFTPQQDGDYLVTLKPVDTSITSDISTTLYAGPHATATFTVSPAETPPGDVDVTGKIHITGAGAASGATQDPLVPLIKEAIQKGVNFEEPAVISWHNTNQCYGCHIQTQALYGLETSRTRVTVDENVTRTLFDALKGWQNPDGSVTSYPYIYSFEKTQTQLALWAYTSWHDENESKPYILKSANYLLSKQSSDGSWACDHCSGWWGSRVSATALTLIGISKAYSLSNDTRYLTSLTKAVQYLLTPDLIPIINNMLLAHQVIGLEAALSVITEQTLKGQITDIINTAISQLKTTQTTDGGWGKYIWDESDSLVTAQVVYAIAKADVSREGQSLREATLFLLNNQEPDGSWYSQNRILSTRLAATTWVIISLPIAFERIGGIDTDLYLTFPDNVVLNSSNPIPTDSISSNYHWKILGVTEEGKDVTLDLTLESLLLGEERKVAVSADLMFTNTYTNETITIPIDIPTVTGISPVAIDVITDKVEYIANEDVNITTTINNISPDMRSPGLTLTVEDSQGNLVEQIADFQIEDLKPRYLPGWNNRIKLTMDRTKFDEDLTDFPVRIHLSSTSGINNADVSDIFDELGVNRKRIAVSSDSTSQSYIEIERWDEVNKEAELWVNVPFISSSADTILYLYYDSSQADNTAYVGNTGDAVAENVWNNNYKAVWHMAQDPSGAAPQILDSTVNIDDGTSNGDMTSSDLVDGFIGEAIDFDGVDDEIRIGTKLTDVTNTFTMGMWISPVTTHQIDNEATGGTGGTGGQTYAIYPPRGDTGAGVGISVGTNGVSVYEHGGNYMPPLLVWQGTLSGWTHIMVVYINKQPKLYVNGSYVKTGLTSTKTYIFPGPGNTDGVGGGYWGHFNGLIDEVSISRISYSPAWIKASYYSQSDNLISFGSAESIDDIDPSPTQTFTFIWNTGITFSGDYLVRAELYEDEIFRTEDTANFTILPDKTLDSNVTTDKIEYNPNENAVITSTVTSLNENTILYNLSAVITIADSLGTALYSEINTVPVLVPGQLKSFNTYWNTSTNPSGDYPVTLEVKDSSGNVLSVSTKNLTISSEIDPSKLLIGQISVDKQSLLQGETVNIDYSVTNVGNIDLAQVDLSIPVVHVVELTAYDTLTDQTALQMSETYTNLQPLGTQTYSAKDYLVILRASISGIEETLASTYFRVEGMPSAPSLYWPAEAEDIETLTPELIVNNASDPNDDDLTYEFEIYTDDSMTNLLASSDMLAEGEGITSWPVPLELEENAVYYWRARAFDGLLYGDWMSPASFRVNLINEPPTAPTLSSPADNSEVSTFTPILVVNNASDPDSENLTYNFELALDIGFTQIVASEIGIFEGEGTTSWQVPVSLSESTYYYWRAQADDWLIEGPWMTPAGFFVNTANEAPSVPVIISPADGSEITTLSTDIIASNSLDPDNDPLTYVFEADTVMTFDSPDLRQSGIIPEGQGTTSWLLDGLNDNTYYYVRAKASDGLAESPWSEVIGFFVNTVNDVPTRPILANPSDGGAVNVFNPELSVYNSFDIDGDILTYEFEIYKDDAMVNLIAEVSGVEETLNITSWTVPVSLIENETYYWRARAFDEELYSSWMPLASFMVNTANDAPSAPALYSPAEGSSVDTLYPTLAIYNALDPDSDSLTYDFEIYSDGLLIQSITGIPENITGITSITLGEALSDNTIYRWRARAYDGDRYGAWMTMATFSVHLPVVNITATIDFDPNTLNKKSKGKWVVVYIEMPEGYNVEDIIVSSIVLQDTIPAEPWPYNIGDEDNDGILDLMVKFKRSDVIAILPNGDDVIVNVTGQVGDVTFEGFDIIRVIP